MSHQVPLDYVGERLSLPPPTPNTGPSRSSPREIAIVTSDGREIDFSTWKEMDVPPSPVAVMTGTAKVKEKGLAEVGEEKAGKVEEKKAAGGKKPEGEEGKGKTAEEVEKAKEEKARAKKERKKAAEERERSLEGWRMAMEERERVMEERRNAVDQRKEADEEENTVAAPHSTPPTVMIVEDLSRIVYPDGIAGPKPELNVNSKKGGFM